MSQTKVEALALRSVHLTLIPVQNIRKVSNYIMPMLVRIVFKSKSKSTALQAQYLPQGELSALTNHV